MDGQWEVEKECKPGEAESHTDADVLAYTGADYSEKVCEGRNVENRLTFSFNTLETQGCLWEKRSFQR